MKTKNLITALIQQDLKHTQFLLGLDKLHLQATETQHLDLLDVIYDLMKVPESAELDWGKTYSNYMNKAFNYRPWKSSEEIKNQAELCYLHLKAIVDVENAWELRAKAWISLEKRSTKPLW